MSFFIVKKPRSHFQLCYLGGEVRESIIRDYSNANDKLKCMYQEGKTVCSMFGVVYLSLYLNFLLKLRK